MLADIILQQLSGAREKTKPVSELVTQNVLQVHDLSLPQGESIIGLSRSRNCGSMSLNGVPERFILLSRPLHWDSSS